MARHISGTRRIRVLSAVVTNPPFTFAGWIYPLDTTSTHTMIAVSRQATPLRRVQMACDGSITRLRLFVAGDTTSFTLNGGTFVANQWQHGCVVAAAANDWRLFYNGGDKATSTTNVGTLPLDATGIGGRVTAGDGIANVGNCYMTECTFWSVALTDSEVAILAKGIDPRCLRPQNIVAHVPVWGIHDPEIELSTANRTWGLLPTTDKPPRVGTHAPLVPFTPRLWEGVPFLGEAAILFRRNQFLRTGSRGAYGGL